MRRIAPTALATLAALAFAASAQAAPVLVLHGHRTSVRHERFAGATELAAPPRARPHSAPPTSHARVHAARSHRAPLGRRTRSALDALLAQGQIDQPTHDARLASLKRALRAYRKLHGTRRTELGAVIANADTISAAGSLTSSRLPAVFATLDANRKWWTTGPLLSSGRRVSLGGSQVIWQYYPGQGIELQMLANFGKANALWSGHHQSTLRKLLSELVPLAADRGGWPAFEYYFRFGGGVPPWTSSISQGTAVQVLARASQMLGDPSLRDLGERALAAFEQPPPAGVREDTPTGPFYLIYSFAPDQLVINAHLQAVIGLFDFAQITGDPRAQGLYTAGEAEARAVVAHYDTGAWSLYDQRSESDLNYHELVTTFLKNLCKRSGQPVYCDTADRFKEYMHDPPAVAPTTHRIRTGRAAHLAFSLNKISRVGLVVSRGDRTVFQTSATVGRGSHFFTWSTPAKPGTYDFRVRATDLAGNTSEPEMTTLRILKQRHGH